MAKPALDTKCPKEVLEKLASIHKGHTPDSMSLFKQDQSHDFYMGMMAACRVFSEMVKLSPIEGVIGMMGDINVSAMLLANEKKSPIIQMPGIMDPR